MRAWTSSVSFVACVLCVSVIAGCPAPPAVEDAFVAEVDGGTGGDVGLDAPECGSDAECDDGLFCSGVETCTLGRCLPGPVACDDGIECTIDACDEALRRCANDVPDVDADGYGDAVCIDAAGVPLGNDCADDDLTTFPGNHETCDDLGHDEDCDSSTHGGTDADSDGYESIACCNPDPLGGSPLCGLDCDDARAATSPIGTETCDGLDQNCDGEVDEGTLLDGFEDLDFDGYGGLTEAHRCAAAVGFARIGGDCDDANPSANPGLPELCDVGAPVDNNCDGSTTDTPGTTSWFADDDGDGFGSAASGVTISCEPVPNASLRGSDCNDARADINPSQAERCDGLDDDCNGTADFLIGPNNFEDDDGDLLVDIACVPTGTDCDDTNPATGPGERESCDGRDNDCDTRIDEGATSLVYYRDEDADGFGSVTSGTIVACMTSVGYVARAGDCNDADATRFPGASELCDAGDDDCDSAIDEAPAAAACMPIAHTVIACLSGGRCGIESCESGYSDCNHDPSDGCEAMGSGPGTPDVCDGADNDCDSRIDEDAPTRVYHRDLDGDGFGSATSGTVISCMAPVGHVTGAGDCNDTDATRYPGASELCDAGDNDCDSAVDEAPATASCGAIANGVAGCLSGGRCGVASCAAAFADCNADSGDGCEAQLTTDVNHCGTCAIDCNDAPRVTAAVCEASGCRITACALGYQDCDGFAGNGCEIGTSSDPLHCGSCTNACGVSQVCSAGACALGCAPGLVVCDGQCVNPQSDVSYCGATGACGMGSGSRGAICRPGEACASGACFASFISPGIDAVSMTWPRDVTYTIDAPGAATIFYTLDGTVPGVSGSTVMAAAPVSLSIGGLSGDPPTPRIVRWVAQFGGGGTETIVHEVRIGWSSGYTSTFGEIPELLTMNGGGPVIAVAPGAAVTGSVSLQHWHSDPGGYCPTCVIQANIGVDGVGQVECHYMGDSSYPGSTNTYGFSFTAPTTPGRYYVRAGMPLDFTCAAHAGGAPIGVLYVR